MACIKYLSKCACARCLVLKSKFPLLGSKRDMQDRLKLKRVDDQNRRDAIELARKLIFEKGVSLGSKQIADILGSKSLVPTRVSLNKVFHSYSLKVFIRMHFRNAYLKSDLITMSYLS